MRLVQASESVLFSSLQPTYRSMGIFFLHRCEVTIKIVVSIRPSLRLHAHSNLKPPEHFFIIGVQPLGRFGQRPELSQPTGMVLVRCILGKFLEVVCHCFPPRLEVPNFGGRWNCGRECCPVILPKWRLPRHSGIFYMPQIYDMGLTALLPLRRKACWGFFRP